MKLTPVQKELILALVDLYSRAKGGAVKGEDIAGRVRKNPGTIRNQMQALRAMGIVEGVPGPKGGYRPTTEGYNSLGYQEPKDKVIVPIWIGETQVEELTVTGIDFISIPDPKSCRANIHCIGDLKKLPMGKVVKVGPTPVNKLVIVGMVVGRDDIDNVLLIDILEMSSIPKEKIAVISSKNMRTISPDMSVREAANILFKEKIRGAPVIKDGEPLGVISTVDITRAVAEQKENDKVSNVMSTEIHTINENAPMSLAIERMESNNVSRLIVVDKNGKPTGVVTRTDILYRIAKFSKLSSSGE